MATKEQIDRIVQLRGQGWTQAQIAEEVDMSPQAVSYQLKKRRESPMPITTVKMIHASGFEPKDTVITFEPKDFENFRENDNIYVTGQDLFEMRSGVIHKTTLPQEIPPSVYPEIHDIVSAGRDFTFLPDREEILDEWKKEVEGWARPVYGSRWGRLIKSIILPFYFNYGERNEAFLKGLSTRQSTVNEMDGMLRTRMAAMFDAQIPEFMDSFHPTMPPAHEIGKLIRYVADNNLSEKDILLENHAISKAEEGGLFEIIAAFKTGNAGLEGLESARHEIWVQTFLGLGIEESDIEICMKHFTIDPDVVKLLRTSGAPDIESLKLMDSQGFKEWNAFLDHQHALDTAPIVIDSFSDLSSKESKYNSKILDALERENVEDALTASWTRFEIHARAMVNSGKFRITDSNGMKYGREKLEEQFKAQELVDAVLPHVNATEKEVDIMDEARRIRNSELHGEDIDLPLLMKHVRVVLEITERAIEAL